MKSFKKACRGEKGFTLIELLVVIIILGVLAAVVTLAVTRFIGKGTLESANAELVTVQAAVEAAWRRPTRRNSTTTVSAWTGAEATAPEVASENCNVYQQMRTHDLKAAYDIDADGTVSDADPTIDGGWGNSIEFSGGVWVDASLGTEYSGSNDPTTDCGTGRRLLPEPPTSAMRRQRYGITLFEASAGDARAPVRTGSGLFERTRPFRLRHQQRSVSYPEMRSSGY